MKLKNNLILCVICILLASCQEAANSNIPQDRNVAITQIDSLLNNWHRAAAAANLANYIGAMSKESIYIGTDASENWTRTEFEAFCKPYFDKKTTWHFTPLERNIYISTDSKNAWFDELLDTQMGVCRGSGAIEKGDSTWKIKHYVLSMTIPNDKSNDVTAIKATIEDSLISQLRVN